MRITDLDLSNYRCFEAANLSFEPGVTVIHGPNGSGKTTILESILFGLYGSRALDDATLEDVITTGETASSVSLTFSHEGETYHLVRELAMTGDRPSTRSCTLETPAGELVEGARPVRSRVSELLRMDAEAFVNSAYVKQGEINKLLHATPAERRSMIDELLQLGQLETYRDRADEARLAVRSLRDERSELIDEVETQIERHTERDLYDRLNELETERATVLKEIEEATESRDELLAKRDEIESMIEGIDERRERLATLRDRRERLQGSLEETESERTRLRDRLDEHRTRLDGLASRRDDLAADLEVEPTEAALDEAESTLEDERQSIEDDIDERRADIEERTAERAELVERIDSITAQLDEAHEEISALGAAADGDREVINERSSERDELRDRRDDLGSTLDAWPIEPGTYDCYRDEREAERDAIREDLREHRERIATLREHIAQAESLLEQERCPTCGQPVDEAPHVDRLDREHEELERLTEEADRLEDDLDAVESALETIDELVRIDERIETVEQLIDERSARLEERSDRLESLRERVQTLASDRDEATAQVETIESAIETRKEEVEAKATRSDELRERLADLDRLRDIIGEIESITTTMEQLRERRDDLSTLQAERMDQLDEVNAELADLEEELDEERLEQLKQAKSNVDERLAELEQDLETLGDRRDQLNERIGSVQADIEQLETLERRHDELADQFDDLDQLTDEATSLGDLYESVRADLRERNVATLERLLNETFDLLYRNDAYDRIHLDADYSLAISQKDGTKLDPLQLSGGERAIFNLSLRCAIYRLLAEGVEGAAPMPPLMLDEPTVFLDEGHVGRLLHLLEAMREMGVEQTLVVSHHGELLDAAEQLVAVEKDPTTNRSRVRQLEASPVIT